MFFNGFLRRTLCYMENKELSINLNEDKLNIAKLKNKNSANYKLIYALISTIVTVFATIYSDEKQLVIISILLFTFPSYLESIGVTNKNPIIKIIIKAYSIVFIILPIILISLSLYECIKNLKNNRQLAKTSLKMATTHYPSVITMFIGMIKDHQAQIQYFGESTYSYNKNKEGIITKKEVDKSWLTSFPNIRYLLTSEGFKSNFFNNLAEA